MTHAGLSLVLILAVFGCGGNGSVAPDVITPANESHFSDDAKTLTVRATTGPWLPAFTAAQFDADLGRIRKAYPVVSDLRATPLFVATIIVLQVKSDAPWIERWKLGILATRDAAMDRLLDKYHAVKVDGGDGTFLVSFAQSLNVPAIIDEFSAASDRFIAVFPARVGYTPESDDVAFDSRHSPRVYGFTKGSWFVAAHTYESTLMDDGTITKREYDGYPPYGHGSRMATGIKP